MRYVTGEYSVKVVIEIDDGDFAPDPRQIDAALAGAFKSLERAFSYSQLGGESLAAGLAKNGPYLVTGSTALFIDVPQPGKPVHYMATVSAYPAYLAKKDDK